MAVSEVGAEETLPPPPPTLAPTGTASPFPPSPIPSPTPDWSLAFDEAHPGVEYSIPLMTQHVAPGRAVLFFQLTSPVEGRLFYWRTDLGISSAQWAPISASERRQQIEVVGLDPGETYGAALGLRGADSEFRPPYYGGRRWGPIQIRTPEAGQTTWRAGVVGDSGFGEQLTADLARRMAGQDLDFVIHTGDLVYKVDQNADPPSAFRYKFFEPFAPILKRMPLYPVAGNHDWDPPTVWGGVPYYYWAFPRFDPVDGDSDRQSFRNEYYAFVYGDVQFLMLNTQLLLRDGAQDAQIGWLSERLSDERYRYSIPVFHVPPYTSGLHTLDGQAVRDYWQPLFEEANVPLVLSGHDHDYERIDLHGVTYIVSGGGSSVLYGLRARVPGSQVFVSASHYLELDFSPQSIHLRAVGPEGELLDEVDIPTQR
jgi:predicted phosphodiesterase